VKIIGLLIALPLLAILKVVVLLITVYVWFRDLPNRLAERKVRRRGVPVRGWWVQANNSLWEEGKNDSPAQIVFSFDERADDELLQRTALEVFRLKSEPATTNLERAVAKLVDDETYRRGTRIGLPYEFTGGIPIYCAHVMVRRRFLPEGMITLPYADFKAIPTGNPKTVAMTEPR
jgi:hypothetical protein